MKTRHAQGVPCPHNKGNDIEVLDVQAIDCLACKYILRRQPEVKEAFEQLIAEEKENFKKKIKPEKRKKSWQQKKRERVKGRAERETALHRTKYQSPNCPKCKEKMVLRTNTIESTHFWGCSRYPNCKGTKKM